MFARFVKTFESDPRWLWRVLAAGALGLVLALETVWQGRAKLGPGVVIALLISLPAFFLAGGCLLATMDSVRQRIRSDRSIGRFARVFFGRWWSLLLWFILLLLIGFPLAVFVGNLTWRRF